MKKLIIDISEEIYMAICDNGYIFDEDSEDIAKAIKNGTSVSNEGDLISREALKKAFKIEELYWGKRIIDIIDNAPTVVVGYLKSCTNCDSGYAQGYSDGYLKGKEDRPQGEWIKVTRRISDCETSTWWECPICKEHDRKDGKSKYCSECGAKMGGGEEE